MPDAPNIPTYPPILKVRVVEGTTKEIKVDKPAAAKDARNKGVKVRVMKTTKRPPSPKRRRDPRNREYF
jgi:hypothetical protein